MLNTSRRLVNKNSLTWWYVFKTSWRCLQDVFARRLEDVLKTSWRCLEDVLKTSWRRLEDVLKTFLQDVLKTSWKRLEDVLKTYGQDEYIGLDQDVLKTSFEDVFWRRKINKNIFVLMTSFEDEDERRVQDVFIKTNVCWVGTPLCGCFWYYLQMKEVAISSYFL